MKRSGSRRREGEKGKRGKESESVYQPTNKIVSVCFLYNRGKRLGTSIQIVSIMAVGIEGRFIVQNKTVV